jgi:hypothetical protein
MINYYYIIIIIILIIIKDFIANGTCIHTTFIIITLLFSSLHISIITLLYY